VKEIILTFSGSEQIQKLFSKVENKYLESKLKELSDILEIDLSDAAMKFLLVNPIYLKYASLCNALNKIKIYSKYQTQLRDLSKYFAAREFLEFAVPEYSLFDAKIDFPKEFSLAAETGAEGLYKYGINQFKALKKHCEDIVDFVVSKKIKNVCLIESPLGNIVPIQVLTNLFEINGINFSKVSLSLPRNDRPKYGFTFKEIIINNIELITNGNDLVLYIDDVISGSRFRKISTALKKAVGQTNSYFIPCALVFRPHATPNFIWKADYSQNRSTIKKRAEEFYKEQNFFPWFEIPELPKFKIDAGLPIVYESPVIWGEQPIVAGMKKVNFVFNIIEQFEAILNDIVTNDYKSRDFLMSLWSKDTNGVTYIVPESIVLDTFLNIKEEINWQEIKEAAKVKFSVDYSGGI
jgi:hypothetical protein